LRLATAVVKTVWPFQCELERPFLFTSSLVERLARSGLDVYQQLFVLNASSATGLSGQLRGGTSVFRQLLCELNRV
jgi:hypothetical protein